MSQGGSLSLFSHLSRRSQDRTDPRRVPWSKTERTESYNYSDRSLKPSVILGLRSSCNLDVKVSLLNPPRSLIFSNFSRILEVDPTNHSQKGTCFGYGFWPFSPVKKFTVRTFFSMYSVCFCVPLYRVSLLVLLWGLCSGCLYV